MTRKPPADGIPNVFTRRYDSMFRIVYATAGAGGLSWVRVRVNDYGYDGRGFTASSPDCDSVLWDLEDELAPYFKSHTPDECVGYAEERLKELVGIDNLSGILGGT